MEILGFRLQSTEWFFAILIYPLLEELVFRWGMLGFIDRNKYRPYAVRLLYNLITCTLFGALHAIYWPVQHAVFVSIASFIMGWLWQRYRSLVLCVFTHALMNWTYIALIKRHIAIWLKIVGLN